MSEIKFEKLKIEDIKGYENNAKEHPQEQISKIRDSIISFGYLDPIAVDEDNIIIEGHGRLAAIKQISADPKKEIKILRVIGLDEGQKRAYRIAHNKLNMETGFDLDKLGKEFNLLEGSDFFKDTGFDTKEITEIWERDEKEEKSSELVESEKKSVALVFHTKYLESSNTIVPIPEKRFNYLKAKHLRKLKLSKLISKNPGCPVLLLNISVLYKSIRNIDHD